MSFCTGLRCLRCEKTFPISPMLRGCTRCKEEGLASSLTVTYDYDAIKKRLDRDSSVRRRTDMWRYHELLPVEPENIISIGEGNTPLIRSRRLSQTLGLPDLLFKDETRNPTWAFKDRLGSAVISKAVEFGARVITDSSTGNQGATSAAHAALAGLPAVIFTYQHGYPTMHAMIRAYGAILIITRESGDRAVLLRKFVDRFGWFPTCNISSPPVGSNPWGIEGYKTIAYEICEQLNWSSPQAIFFPSDFGDGITGMYKAFNEFIDLGFISGPPPRMYAIERFGSLAQTLKEGLDSPVMVSREPTIALSIATTISAFQALYTLRASGGQALVVDDIQIQQAQVTLAEQESFYVEPASAAALAGLKQAVSSNLVHKDETVVIVLTSTGLKTSEVTESAYRMDTLPIVSNKIEETKQVLREVYNFDPESLYWSPGTLS